MELSRPQEQGDELPEDLGPCTTHGRMNCLECFDIEPEEVESELEARERDWEENRPQTLADVGMCEGDFR